MPFVIPTLREGAVTIRAIRIRDARALERALTENRSWLRPWEATNPHGPTNFDVRTSIRSLQAAARAGTTIPFVIEVDGELVGQLNVSGIGYGSLSSASVGYWVVEGVAGRGITPTAVALATDYCLRSASLHRIEICIRPENRASLRVVEKLGFRYEGLRRKYIHINGAWRDHFSYALTGEELPDGLLARWKSGRTPPDAASVPEADRRAAGLDGA